MELLKLLIADDEENIRNGLKCILDWESLGYKVCGEASNGKDAVSQIIDLKPDLIILDIKMPGLTGVEVISQIKDYYDKRNMEFPAFIILSGYSEFEYAQKTVNLGAKAYLLKPVDEDDLQSIVLKIAEDIKEKRKLTRTFKNVETLELKDTLVNLLENQKYDKTQLQMMEFFENSEETNYQVAIFYLDYCENYNPEPFYKSLENYFSFFIHMIIKHENKIVIFFKAKNEQGIKNCLERSAKLNKNRTFITLGNNYLDIEGLIQSYKDAIKLEKYFFFLSKVPFISSENINLETERFDTNEMVNIIEKLIFCIETYDKNQLDSQIEQISKKLFVMNEKPEIVKKQIISCLVELKNKLAKKYPERDILNDSTFDIVPNILEFDNFDACMTYFKNLCYNLIENFNFNTADSVIIKVIAYVKSNFCSDLKLEALGDMFNCNSAYLGKKFKKYTGVQFNTYLDNLRIEEAKNKIKNTELKIYQISKLVGYSNTDYFFMKFKKSTGLTPKDYKKKMEEENEKNN